MPHHSICGFRPADEVAKIPGLRDGPKRLYALLVRRAGRNSHCWPGILSLASDLGKCERQIRRDLATLEKAGLVIIRQRGAMRSNEYRFLFHDVFTKTSHDRQQMSDHDRTPVSDRIPEVGKPEEEEEHDFEHQPAFSAEPSPQAGEGAVDGEALRAEWQTAHRRFQPAAAPPSAGQLRVLREMASAAAARPVDDAELCHLIRTTGTPKRRVQAYAWWQRAISNRLRDIRDGYEQYRPESSIPSPASAPPTDTFARFLDYEDLPARVM